MRKTDWLVALTLALCAVGVAACGGGSGSGGGNTASSEEAGLEFAQCMREHGVEVEDPKPGQQNFAIGDRSDPTSKAALAACKGKLGSQEMSSGEQEEFKEGALALAQCLRDEGIDMGDPEFLGPGKFHLDIAGIDTSSPAFEAALEACDDKLPDLPGLSIGG